MAEWSRAPNPVQPQNVLAIALVGAIFSVPLHTAYLKLIHRHGQLKKMLEYFGPVFPIIFSFYILLIMIVRHLYPGNHVRKFFAYKNFQENFPQTPLQYT